MKYIKKVILENFQSHKYTEIDLDPSLNVIVGPSDQGKSAIIRGIKWALFNEPSGDFFIREGAQECSVSIIFSDNTKIKRYRSNRRNAYYYYDSLGNEEVYEGFGTNVPQEIMDKTGIRKISIDSSLMESINIGEQLESPFLLSTKSSHKANAIGRLVGVHIIDDALKDTLRDVRNLKIENNSHKERLEDLRKSLKEYDYLEDLKKRYKKLEEIRDKIQCKQETLNNLSNLLMKLEKYNEEIKLSKYYLEKLKSINEVEEIETRLIETFHRFKYIKNQQDKLFRVENQLKIDKKIVNSLDQVEKVDKVIGHISQTLNQINRLKKLYINNTTNQNNLDQIKVILEKLKELDSIEKNINSINKLYLDYKAIVGLNEKLSDINKRLSIGKVYLDKLKNIDKINSIKERIGEKKERLRKLVLHKETYNTISFKLEEEKRKTEEYSKTIDFYLRKYETILNKVEICPFCLSTINKSTIHNIIEGIRSS